LVNGVASASFLRLRILKQNALVRHLVESANDLYEPGAEFPDIETLDDKYPPSSTFCPLHADSSQLRAVLAATEGRSFVLQGPPGTGKSQTITNLIAHSLTVGKRVLFVAQKRAALDVVHKRLADVGLSPFCLELHSNKTTKESFRNQMREALNVAGSGSSQHWEAETNRLAELRRGLNEYVRGLHLPRAFGKSAYWIISRLIGRESEPKVTLDLGDPADRTDEEFEQMRAAVREMAEAAKVTGDLVGHPLSAVRLSGWVYGIEDDAQRAIQNVEEALKTFRGLATTVLPDVGLNAEEASLFEHKLASELTAQLETAPSVTQAILSEADWATTKTELGRALELGQGCAERQSALQETYTEALLALDLPGLVEKLQTRKDVWFYKKWRMGAFVRKAVRAARKDGKKPKDLAALEKELGAALTVVEDTEKLDKQGSELSRLLGPYWQDLDSKWDDLKSAVDWVDRFRPILDRAPGVDLDAKLKARGTWIRLATEGRSLFAVNSPTGQQSRA
jgi:AAA domain